MKDPNGIEAQCIAPKARSYLLPSRDSTRSAPRGTDWDCPSCDHCGKIVRASRSEKPSESRQCVLFYAAGCDGQQHVNS